MALGVALLRQRRDLPAGLALGLLFLKVQWLPLIVLILLVKARWRALAGLAAAGLVLGVAATLALGPAWIPAYARVFLDASSNGEAYLLTPAASHSLNGGIYALLGPGAASLVTPLNLLGTLLVAALVLWAWLRAPWKPRTPAWDARMGLTLLAAIFTNLQLNTHDLSLLVLPAALGFAAIYGGGAVAARFTLLWHASLWLLYFSPFLVSALLDPEEPLPIRLTTWAMGLMLALLAMMSFKDRGNPQIAAGA
jgi:hypothetical protein